MAYELSQTFFQAFLLFIVADTGVAEVVVIGSVVVVDVEVE